MKYYLVKFNSNWADEMSIYGHLAMKEKEYLVWKNRIDSFKFPINCYVGTNEDIDITKADYSTQEISEQEYKTLKKLKLLDIGSSNCITLEYHEENEGALE